MIVKNGLANLIAVIIHAVGFSFYLWVLYYSGYPAVYTKGCMYFFMAMMHIYLVYDEWNGISNYKQLQFNTINKSIFISNFILIALTIFNVCDGVYLMFVYLLGVTITSVFILKSGLQHDYFKNE